MGRRKTLAHFTGGTAYTIGPHTSEILCNSIITSPWLCDCVSELCVLTWNACVGRLFHLSNETGDTHTVSSLFCGFTASRSPQNNRDFSVPFRGTICMQLPTAGTTDTELNLYGGFTPSCATDKRIYTCARAKRIPGIRNWLNATNCLMSTKSLIKNAKFRTSGTMESLNPKFRISQIRVSGIKLGRLDCYPKLWLVCLLARRHRKIIHWQGG